MTRRPQRQQNFATDSVDAATVHRREMVRQAMDKIVGGPLPYDPDVHLYFPNLPFAQAILDKSLRHCAAMDYRQVTFQEARAHLDASFAKLGVTRRAPFAGAVAAHLSRSTR